MFLKPSTAISKIISIQYNTISFKVIMTHYTFCWCGSCCERISLLLLGAKKWPAVNRRFKFRNSKEDNISYKIRKSQTFGSPSCRRISVWRSVIKSWITTIIGSKDCSSTLIGWSNRAGWPLVTKRHRKLASIFADCRMRKVIKRKREL